MCTVSSEYSLIKTIVIVVNLLALPKLCNLADKLPLEPFQKKSGPLASSHFGMALTAVVITVMLHVRGPPSRLSRIDGDDEDK